MKKLIHRLFKSLVLSSLLLAVLVVGGYFAFTAFGPDKILVKADELTEWSNTADSFEVGLKGVDLKGFQMKDLSREAEPEAIKLNRFKVAANPLNAFKSEVKVDEFAFDIEQIAFVVRPDGSTNFQTVVANVLKNLGLDEAAEDVGEEDDEGGSLKTLKFDDFLFALNKVIIVNETGAEPVTKELELGYKKEAKDIGQYQLANEMAAELVEQVLPKAFNELGDFKLSVDSFTFDLETFSLDLNGLTIEHPEGFAANPADTTLLKLGRLKLKLDPGSVGTDLVTVADMEIEVDEVNFVKRNEEENSATALAEMFALFSGIASEEEVEEEPAKEFLIERMKLAVDEVSFVEEVAGQPIRKDLDLNFEKAFSDVRGAFGAADQLLVAVIEDAFPEAVAQLTGFQLGVGSALVDSEKALIDLKGINLSNPGNMPDPTFVTINQFKADYNQTESAGGVITLDEVVVDIGTAGYVSFPSGSNIKNFVASLEGLLPREEEKDTASNAVAGEEEEKTPFLIKKLTVRFGEMVYANYDTANPKTRKMDVGFSYDFTNVSNLEPVFAQVKRELSGKGGEMLVQALSSSLLNATSRVDFVNSAGEIGLELAEGAGRKALDAGSKALAEQLDKVGLGEPGRAVIDSERDKLERKAQELLEGQLRGLLPEQKTDPKGEGAQEGGEPNADAGVNGLLKGIGGLLGRGGGANKEPKEEEASAPKE